MGLVKPPCEESQLAVGGMARGVASELLQTTRLCGHSQGDLSWRFKKPRFALHLWHQRDPCGSWEVAAPQAAPSASGRVM